MTEQGIITQQSFSTQLIMHMPIHTHIYQNIHPAVAQQSWKHLGGIYGNHHVAIIWLLGKVNLDEVVMMQD